MFKGDLTLARLPKTPLLFKEGFRNPSEHEENGRHLP